MIGGRPPDAGGNAPGTPAGACGKIPALKFNGANAAFPPEATMHSIKIAFEEMPAVIVDGADAGFLDGQVEVEFDRHGWRIEGISIEVPVRTFDSEQQMLTTKWVLKPLTSPEHSALLHHLTEVIEDRLSDYIDRQIDEWRQAIADDFADYRREERKLEAMR